MVVAAVAALCAGSATAEAQDQGSRKTGFTLVLASSSPPVQRCGGLGPLREIVERRLRRPVFVDEDADFTLALSVEELPGQQKWRAHIVETDRAHKELGDRTVTLDAPDCARARDALGVVLAIMIGPPRAVAAPAPAPSSQGAPTPAPPTAAPPPPQAPSRPRPVPATTRPPEGRWRLAPGFELVAGTGVLPHLAWGVQGGLALHPPDAGNARSAPWLVARAAYWPGRSTGTVPEGRVDRLSFTALGCVGLGRRGPRLALCTGIEAGRLTATAPELAGERAFARALFALPFEGQLGLGPYRWGSIGFEPRATAQIAVLLTRDRFAYDAATKRETTLHQPAPAAFQTSAGIALHFF